MTIRRLSLFSLALLIRASSWAHAQTFTVLYNFDENPHGCCSLYPGVMAQGRDGNIYGTTTSWGANAANANAANGFAGTIFAIRPDGSVTTLYSFCSQPACTDGAGPAGALLQATNGNFYATTEQGGVNNVAPCSKSPPAAR